MIQYQITKNMNVIDATIAQIKMKDLETILKYYETTDFDEMIKSMKRELKIREIMENE